MNQEQQNNTRHDKICVWFDVESMREIAVHNLNFVQNDGSYVSAWLISATYKYLFPLLGFGYRQQNTIRPINFISVIIDCTNNKTLDFPQIHIFTSSTESLRFYFMSVLL